MPTESSGIDGPAVIAQWPRWVWAAIGGAIGLFDFFVLIALDADLRIAGRDATMLIGLLFFVPYALLGWAVGGLIKARRQSEEDRRVIASQIRTLERTQRALVQEEKLAGIGRLAAGVAHEVRNPLGVIRASASMAQESFDPETDPHRALGFVCDETDRLDRLIASLLTFAKPQPIECTATDLGKVVDRVQDLARHESDAQAVALETEVASGLPTVEADPDRLAQAIFGLALNGIQAAAAGEATPPRVLIRAESRGDGVRIEVRDSAGGIPAELADQIFEPFVTSKETGTGLGLPMALRMIEAQGGRLFLDEENTDPDWPGACFVIEMGERGGGLV